MSDRGDITVLAVSSGGGHWVELLRLLPGIESYHVVFVTVDPRYGADVPGYKVRVVNDATRWDKFGLMLLAVRMGWILWREKPDVVISTGAAPGYFALRIGKWMGVKTIWVDSMANVDCLSMSGQRVGGCADLWLTQWPHLQRQGGPIYKGRVL